MWIVNNKNDFYCSTFDFWRLNLAFGGLLCVTQLPGDLCYSFTCGEQACFWCWIILKLSVKNPNVNNMLKRLSYLNIFKWWIKCLFQFLNRKKDAFAVITIIRKIVWGRIFWFSIRVFLRKTWVAFVKDFLEFLRSFSYIKHDLKLLFLKKKFGHVIRDWSLWWMLKKILLNNIHRGIIF